MEFDYSKPLEGKQMKQLQKDFNTPPPIGTDLDATPKPSSSSHKKVATWPLLVFASAERRSMYAGLLLEHVRSKKENGRTSYPKMVMTYFGFIMIELL